MSGAVDGEQREHAAVPVAHPRARRAAVFILNVKTPTGGTRKSTGAAVYAGKRDILPEGGLVKFVCADFF